MKILLATDAWHPQINGVVRTLSTMVEQIRSRGHDIEVIAAGDFPAVALPMYPEIKVSVWLRGLAQRIDAFDPDAIHISTEGPIGQYVRRHCLRRGYSFTTSFHTRFPEYIRERLPVPLSWTYPLIRRFHRPAFRTLVPTRNLKQDLEQRGFEHLQVWGRGVDIAEFSSGMGQTMALPRPIMLNVGRIAPEKNLEAFLDLKLPGSKIVVGDGPQLQELVRRYPDAVFPGAKQGAELAAYYASADVFVFPSLTDTFGLVMLESIACGTPVAAFPVTGPVDVIEPGITGVLNSDLSTAIEQALLLERTACEARAAHFSWQRIATQLIDALVPVNCDKLTSMEAKTWQNPATPA